MQGKDTWLAESYVLSGMGVSEEVGNGAASPRGLGVLDPPEYSSSAPWGGGQAARALKPAELRPMTWSGIQGLRDPGPVLSPHLSSPPLLPLSLPCDRPIPGPIFQGPVQQHVFLHEVSPTFPPFLWESTSSRCPYSLGCAISLKSKCQKVLFKRSLSLSLPP